VCGGRSRTVSESWVNRVLWECTCRMTLTCACALASSHKQVRCGECSRNSVGIRFQRPLDKDLGRLPLEGVHSHFEPSLWFSLSLSSSVCVSLYCIVLLHKLFELLTPLRGCEGDTVASRWDAAHIRVVRPHREADRHRHWSVCTCTSPQQRYT
jgi:hypothetical protein